VVADAFRQTYDNRSVMALADHANALANCATIGEVAAIHVESIGTSSFTTINVVATASHRCATVRTVQVVLREDRSATRPWTVGERAALEELLAVAGAALTSSTAPGTRPPAR
jgi:hypothetical protein